MGADCHMSVLEIAEATAQAHGQLRPLAPPVKVPMVAPAWLVKILGSVTTFATRRMHMGDEPLVPRSIVDLFLWDPHIDTSKAELELGFKPYPARAGFLNTLQSMEEHGFLRPVPRPDAQAIA